MSLIEVKVEIPPDKVPAADDALLEEGLDCWSVLEDLPSRRAWVIGILAGEAEAQRSWRSVEQVLRTKGLAAPLRPEFRPLGDADWRDSYKAHFRPWRFGRLHWVPLWERKNYSLPEGDRALWLDPGLAFGTGNHETTRLCVERLVLVAEERAARGRVIDAGCGSGILALSAALLGFTDVTGFDNDPEAVRVSHENAKLNGLEDRVRFSTADLVEGLRGPPADILLANIQADVLIRFARELVHAVAPGGVLILSGILASENSDVRTKFEALTPNWTLNARTMGDWSDIQLVRPSR